MKAQSLKDSIVAAALRYSWHHYLSTLRPDQPNKVADTHEALIDACRKFEEWASY